MQVGGNTIICLHTQSYGLGQGMILKDGWIDLLVEFRKLLIKQSTRDTKIQDLNSIINNYFNDSLLCENFIRQTHKPKIRGV
jgi:hypothetical protein